MIFHHQLLLIRFVIGRMLPHRLLYGAISRLEDDGLIRALPPKERRKPYEITDAGRGHLVNEIAKSRALVQLAEQRLGGIAWTG